MFINYLVAEIGSTTTLVTAICNESSKSYIIGQGKSCTTIEEGDVNIGLNNAIKDLENNIGEKIQYGKILASSSAAGGLKITVHGLVEDMTVKAAKEAALGAGGNIKYITSGKLRSSDIKKIRNIKPNLLMISGGTDYGEYETALYNAELIKNENLDVPVIYCGNKAIEEDIRGVLQGYELYVVDNVYPRVDELKVEPTRKAIQTAFEKNIVKAPGMGEIKKYIYGNILPTPGAVMEAAKLLYDIIGDVLVIDVGGATTDVHSVTLGDKKITDILVSPEPKAKRTVEGDLGVYVNSENLINLLEEWEMKGKSREYIKSLIKPIPETEEEKYWVNVIAKKAVEIALNRHVGYVKRIYGTSKGYMAFGKDLSKIKYIIGTGGALIKLGKGEEILSSSKYLKDDITMLPKREAEILIDNKYVMACCGVLMKEDKKAAEQLILQSIGINM
ncbi:GlmL-related ornithine degradation protein [Clostridium polynesiense]|uniref:GlmL-related ornithine degradation protein n=1 Tax=Clostridium polynesiense TaxID=1325933 RepID=UPI00058E278B|nr:GlmL-related ornithine degradation protein [Clostridium polynesiense]